MHGKKLCPTKSFFEEKLYPTKKYFQDKNYIITQIPLYFLKKRKMQDFDEVSNDLSILEHGFSNI